MILRQHSLIFKRVQIKFNGHLQTQKTEIMAFYSIYIFDG